MMWLPISPVTLETMWRTLGQLKINQSHDPYRPLLSICLKDSNSYSITPAQPCSVLLFTITRKWKQPNCPSTEEWVMKTWYTYTTEYYLAIKKDEIMTFAGKSTSKPQRRKFPICLLLDPPHSPWTYHLFKNYTTSKRLLYKFVCVYMCFCVSASTFIDVKVWTSCMQKPEVQVSSSAILSLALSELRLEVTGIWRDAWCVCYVGAESIPKKREEERWTLFLNFGSLVRIVQETPQTIQTIVSVLGLRGWR